MTRFVIDNQVESWWDMEYFPVEWRAEFGTQLGGVQLRGRRERDSKKAYKAIQLRAHISMIARAVDFVRRPAVRGPEPRQGPEKSQSLGSSLLSDIAVFQ